MTFTYHRETHHSTCSKCLLLALRHAVKQSRHWSIDWSMKLWWLLTIFQSLSDAISAHRHIALVSDKQQFLCFGFSWCLQALVHWCGFHAARGESEWCTELLLWCLAAQTVAARHLSSCWRLLLPAHHACTRPVTGCCYTRLRISHQTCGLPIDQTSVL